ncbi:MAG: hypothetical protein LAT68_00625 [Cyclobacteriaceae bacterium]|nr:hypothetical protein [Cyclobacteriaceae bacterium]MCH8514807.1 hypothetical protein [Cyclobacteriaceae bacterium]
MRFWIFFYINFFALSSTICGQASLISEKPLHSVLSGSGMTKIGEHLWVCGDDDPYLYQLDLQGNKLDSVHLWLEQSLSDIRISKKEKPDFEAINAYHIEGDSGLLVWASGSKSPKRDLIYRYSFVDKEVTKYAVIDFYNHLRSSFDWKEKKALNIEGACSDGEHLYILNRSSNSLLKIPMIAFFDFMDSRTLLTDLSIEKYDFNLSKLSGHESTFSGASYLGDGQLLFTASVELSKDAISDGPNLGSFIGVLDLNSMLQSDLKMAQIMQGDKAYQGKVEAAELINITDGVKQIIAITDNDDGGTMFLQLQWVQ